MHYLNIAICICLFVLQQRNSHDEYLANENFLNKQNHFSWKYASNDGSLITKGHDMTIVQHIWGSQVKIQRISQRNVESLKGKIFIWITQGAMLRWSWVWTKSTIKTSGTIKSLVCTFSIRCCQYHVFGSSHDGS